MLGRLWARVRHLRPSGHKRSRTERLEPLDDGRNGYDHSTPPRVPPAPPKDGGASEPVKTMPPGTVTLIHDDGTVSSLPDPDEPTITYVVDELLAAQRSEADPGPSSD